MDGFSKFFGSLKKNERIPEDLRAIILTDDDETDGRKSKVSELGTADYIRKPIHADSLKSQNRCPCFH